MENKEEEKLIKDKECASCKNMFDCKGKLRGISCINYQERKKNG